MKQQFNTFEYYSEMIRVLADKRLVKETEELTEVIYNAYKSEKNIFFIGNGGSATNASHMAADIGKNISKGNQVPFRTISLVDNIAMITAMGNDLGYENIFLGQLRSLGREGDVLLSISASGNSPNLLRANEWANDNRLITTAMTGFDGGKLRQSVSTGVYVESWDYGVVESIHACIQHAIIENLKNRLNNEE